MIKLISSSVFILFTSISVAQENIKIPEIENIISCAMMDGQLAHRLITKDGSYVASMAFPLYFRDPSPEVLEQKKKEWEAWDGTGPMPSDARTVAVAVPIENTNFVSADQERLIERIDMFKRLFPDTENTEYVPFEMGKLVLDFKHENCHITQQDNIISAYCETEPLVISGVNVERVSFHMTNQLVTQITQDPNDSSNLTVKEQNTVSADLVFLINHKMYRSSFTYNPNGNDKQCIIGESNLPKYNN